MTREETLLERIDRRSEPYIQGKCQLWLGGKNSSGYGSVSWRGRMVAVHRTVWEFEKGPIPEGLQVLHTCDNPPCRNLDHLFLGTQAENIADMIAKGRKASRSGEANMLAKLTEPEVLEIRAIPRDVPHSVVAAMYGVTKATAAKVRRGELWTHL